MTHLPEKKHSSVASLPALMVVSGTSTRTLGEDTADAEPMKDINDNTQKACKRDQIST